MGDPDRVADARALIDAVRAAGSYKAYLRALRTPLVALRRLCASGRAGPETDCPEVLRRLFPWHPPVQDDAADEPPSPSARTPQAVQLPKEVFWLILKFWRSDRDSRY